MSEKAKKTEIKITSEEVKEGVPFAVLSYVLFLWILTFIFKKDNQFAIFHARQGIIIFVGLLVCSVLKYVLIMGWLFNFLTFVLAICALYGVHLSLAGRYGRILLISDLAEKLNV